uniref:c-type cytochrome biogenesis protein n=1 Tax=Gloiopeltis furcata TaxID=42017 RepID=UPI0028D694B5|nr:c-type cytochrome biogenesis protein [Gloiopeltis furcata]WMP13988.1 c-type cytochrome biogenesis protein [Gloiopeltis furcata]
MSYIYIKNLRWHIVKKISNLNFSILILLLIACLSILGTIIEQEQNLNYYQFNYPIYDYLNQMQLFNWQTIIYLGLDHIYTTWWFLFFLFIFFCSLTACTFSRQLPSLKNARNWKFKQNKGFEQCTAEFEVQSFSNVVYALNSKNYYVFHKNSNIYGYKGLSGRVAPIFVHISIILTLTGSMIGLLSGFTAQQMIPAGEVFHVQNIIKSGFKSNIPSNILGRINDFSVEYNNDQSIKQFYSNISLENNMGDYLDQKKIYVNSPLKFHGLTFYQTDWQINGLRIKLNQESCIQLKLIKTRTGNTDIWIYNLPIGQNNHISFVITSLKNKTLLYNNDGKFIKAISANEIIQVNNNSLCIIEIMTSTGIQIKTDPGIAGVYIGFLLLMISIIVSYLSYSQIWLSENNINKKLHITGTTNRAKLAFEKELVGIKKLYFQLTLKH